MLEGWRDCTSWNSISDGLPGDSYVLLFGCDLFLIRDHNIRPKKELHGSLQVACDQARAASLRVQAPTALTCGCATELPREPDMA